MTVPATPPRLADPADPAPSAADRSPSPWPVVAAVVAAAVAWALLAAWALHRIDGSGVPWHAIEHECRRFTPGYASRVRHAAAVPLALLVLWSLVVGAAAARTIAPRIGPDAEGSNPGRTAVRVALAVCALGGAAITWAVPTSDAFDRFAMLLIVAFAGSVGAIVLWAVVIGGRPSGARPWWPLLAALATCTVLVAAAPLLLSLLAPGEPVRLGPCD